MFGNKRQEKSELNFYKHIIFNIQEINDDETGNGREQLKQVFV